MFAVVKNPGRKSAKAAKTAAKTANTIPCWPMFFIPIPASLIGFLCRRCSLALIAIASAAARELGLDQ
jgi:hypothetical protein